jgi:Ca2+-binding EF-hand superfamily protein
VLQRLKSYKGESLFKRAAMNMLVKMATSKEVDDLRQTFAQIDKDGTGMILEKELHEIIRSKKLHMSDNEIKDLISEVDY